MFTYKWTPQARADYNQLKDAAKKAMGARKKAKKSKKKSSKQEGLFKQVRKTLDFLKQNPRHQSLNTHEYASFPHPWDPKKKVLEAYAQNKTPGAYRIFWCYGPGQSEITLIAITPHP